MMTYFSPLKFHIYKLSLIICACFLTSCNKDNDEVIKESTQSQKTNILLIIADDMGLDATPGYNIGALKPALPNIESLINSGITFNNVWVNPTCTPTRSSIITGKYGFRTNVIKVGNELPTSEISLQKYIDINLGATYSHAVIGKWHLSTDVNHPANMGINYYAGSLTGSLPSYSNWNLTENGITINSSEYNTTKYTDLAIDWIENQTTPWFLWLAYNTPHAPFHLPPNELHSQGELATDEASINANPIPYYMAMIESMDTEIGRLLNSMSQLERDNTIVIFLGDNGTPSKVTQEYNSNRTKGSIYQGGINVPMVISGKEVLRINQTENALINGTDLYATIASLAGINVTTIHDSQNFHELLSNQQADTREYIFSENGENADSADLTIRNQSHKYMLFNDGSESFYDLIADPFETTNLLKNNQPPLSTSELLIKEDLVDKLIELRY